jgi:hypothetical protein
MSSLAEIRQAIEKLAPKERAELRRWLDAQDIEENPEFLAAVDEGKPLFYICNAASNNDNGPVAALERPLPLLGVQRLSTSLNVSAARNVETR